MTEQERQHIEFHISRLEKDLTDNRVTVQDIEEQMADIPEGTPKHIVEEGRKTLEHYRMTGRKLEKAIASNRAKIQ